MNLFDRFIELMITGVVAIFGGVVAYVYKLSQRREKFEALNFIAVLMVGFFIGALFGAFIPKEFNYRDGVIMLCGLLSFPIIAMIEKDGLDWLRSLVPFLGKKDNKDE